MGFIIINPGLSCLIIHTWFPFPLISMLYMCPLFPLSLSVIVPMSAGAVRSYALVQLLCCMLYIYIVYYGYCPVVLPSFTLTLLFGYSPVFLYMCLLWVYEKPLLCIPTPVSKILYTLWRRCKKELYNDLAGCYESEMCLCVIRDVFIPPILLKNIR
jgi:hypothetical protein